MKSCVLAVDTSTDACSVALLHDGNVYSSHELMPREHTLNILPMVEALLAENGVAVSQVEGFIVGAGPGSFTGLRIAFGVVQGLAFACNKPVAVISTLSALAYQAVQLSELKEGSMLTTIDARMKELYWSRFEVRNGSVRILEGPFVSSAQSIDVADVSVVIGTGLVYKEEMKALKKDTLLYPEERPSAEAMIQYASLHTDVVWQSADQVEPVYVRNNVAKKKLDQK